MKAQAVLLLLKIISWLPLRLARALGHFMGGVLARLNLRPMRVARINLALCYPQLSAQEIDRLSCERMSHLGQMLCETPKLWRKSQRWLDSKIVAVEGRQYLQTALNNTCGTLLLVPHQGNWEVVGLWMATQTTMTSLYEPPKILALEAWIRASRQRSGATLVPTNVRGVAALLKALKRGEMAGILPDQQPAQGSGDFAGFFGVQTYSMTLVHNLIQKSACQALFATALRVKGGWQLHFLPADKTLYATDQRIGLDALNKGVETMVNLAPNQYQWEYKRFRARPEGLPTVYPQGH